MGKRAFLFPTILLLLVSASARGQTQMSGSGGGIVNQDTFFKSGRPWLDLTAAGAACDGTTDDTAVMNAALISLYNQGGGTLMIPAGKTCLIAGQITIPNNGLAAPSMKPIRITSFGSSSMASAASGIRTPNGGGALNLTFNSTTGKIDSRGVGYLEIDHLILEDTATDCAAFIFDTNSVLHAHDNEFYGTASGTSACNDAIVLGGIGSSIDGTATAEFQGYGTVIRDNFFGQTQRAVLGQNQVNGIQIVDNTIWFSSGSATHGAIEFTVNDTGNYITGNLIEVGNYHYGIWFNPSGSAVGNTLIGNSFFDWTATNLAAYRFEAGAQRNTVIDGFDSNLTNQISDANVAGTNTYLTPAQSVVNVTNNPWNFTNASIPIQISGNPVSQQEYDILNGATNDEFFNQVTNVSNSVTWNLVLKPQGGSNVNLFAVKHQSSGVQTDLTLGSSSDATDRVVAIGDLRLVSGASGNVVWLCGNGSCTSFVDSTGKLHTSGVQLTAQSPPSGVSTVSLLSHNTTDNTLHFNSNNNGDLSPSGAWSCTNVTPVTVSANVATDQNLMACTIPIGTLNRVNRTLRVKAKGVYSTPAASTSQMTVKLKLCTVSGCGSGTVITPISIQSTALGTVQITNDNFSLRSEITTQTAGASAAYEASGEFLIDLATLATAADSEFGDTNTATVGTIDSTAQLFLQTTFAFSNASASNSATQRQLIAETVN